MHLVTQSMIQFDKSFCNGGRGDSLTYLAHLGKFLMGVKLFNWNNKQKVVMLKHMISMVINNAIISNWVYLQKYS